MEVVDDFDQRIFFGVVVLETVITKIVKYSLCTERVKKEMVAERES